MADRVFAPHYSAPEYRACAARSAMLRASPDASASAVSQLLHGEAFAVVDISGGWAWGYGLHDNYVGYVRGDALGPTSTATHVVTVPQASVFSRADIKAPAIDTYAIGTRLQGDAVGDFVLVQGGYIHCRHVAPVSVPFDDPVMMAERMIGVPYLWGGRGDGGVDCSGLVQRALGLCGIAAPRDSDQQRALGEEIDPQAALRRGDLIFFPGHVGMMVDGDRMIHANAHWMVVTVEPLAAVIARGAEITARRRIAA